MRLSDLAFNAPAGRFLLSALRVVITGVCCALVMTTLALAQGNRGTIRGTVTDANGAAVVGATARLIKLDRGVDVRSVQTNEEGVYQFIEIDPDTYDIV